jgi:hypothetical protein
MTAVQLSIEDAERQLWVETVSTLPQGPVAQPSAPALRTAAACNYVELVVPDIN